MNRLVPCLVLLVATALNAASSDLLKEGLRQANAGQIDQALATLRQAAAADSGDAAAQTALGLVALQRQQYAEAQAALERALSLDPRSETALFALGLLFEKQRQPGAARSAWQRLAALTQSSDLREMAQRHLERLE